MHIEEEAIQGAMVHNFLLEKQSNVGTHSDVFTSSDTVNELLQGLACNKQDHEKELLELTKDTCDVLPTFAKALDTSSANSMLHESPSLEEKSTSFSQLTGHGV